MNPSKEQVRMINFYEFCRILNENFTRDEVSNHPDMKKLDQYLQNLGQRIEQAEKSQNAQELNSIQKEIEYQIRDNKTALSSMNPQDRQRNAYLTAVSANLQGQWEYVRNVIDRVQRSA